MRWGCSWTEEEFSSHYNVPRLLWRVEAMTGKHRQSQRVLALSGLHAPCLDVETVVAVTPRLFCCLCSAHLRLRGRAFGWADIRQGPRWPRRRPATVGASREGGARREGGYVGPQSPGGPGPRGGGTEASNWGSGHRPWMVKAAGSGRREACCSRDTRRRTRGSSGRAVRVSGLQSAKGQG